MRFRLKEKEVLVGAAAGATAFVLVKKGVAGMVPALGPVPSPVVLILIGLVLAAMVDGGGSGGDVIEGIGYGLIATGAIAL